MKWKNQLEKKIEQQAFIDSFKTLEVFSDYIEDYFKNFFDVENGKEFIEVERNSEKISISISKCKLEVILSEPSIKFRAYTQYNQGSLGQLYFSEMRFTHSGGTKVEEFSEQLLEQLLEKAFKPLIGSSVQVLM